MDIGVGELFLIALLLCSGSVAIVIGEKFMEDLEKVFPHNEKWYHIILYWLIVIVIHAILLVIFCGPFILMFNKIDTGSFFQGLFF